MKRFLSILLVVAIVTACDETKTPTPSVPESPTQPSTQQALFDAATFDAARFEP